MHTFKIIRPMGLYTSCLNFMNICAAWQSGFPVCLRRHDGREFTGLITAIRLESGYQAGQQPTHFLIELNGKDEVFLRIPPASAA